MPQAPEMVAYGALAEAITNTLHNGQEVIVVGNRRDATRFVGNLTADHVHGMSGTRDGVWSASMWQSTAGASTIRLVNTRTCRRSSTSRGLRAAR